MSEKLPERYQSILYRPHPISTKHPPMPREKRAAQFAPFAALTGYGEVIQQTQAEHEEAVRKFHQGDSDWD